MMDPAERARAIEECRRAERDQTVFYRALAADAEAAGDEPLARRFHDLHADEQHHFSRLTALLLEDGHSPTSHDPVAPAVDLTDWESAARERERAEIARYRGVLLRNPDDRLRALVESILEAETHHERALAGKWTLA
jgi:rubrerythrin